MNASSRRSTVPTEGAQRHLSVPQALASIQQSAIRRARQPCSLTCSGRLVEQVASHSLSSHRRYIPVSVATLAGVIFGLSVASWIWIKTRKLEPDAATGSGPGHADGWRDHRVPRPPVRDVQTHGVLHVCRPCDVEDRLDVSLHAEGDQHTRASTCHRARIPPPTSRWQAPYIVLSLLPWLSCNTLLAMYTSQKTWALFNAAGGPVVYSVMGSSPVARCPEGPDKNGVRATVCLRGTVSRGEACSQLISGPSGRGMLLERVNLIFLPIRHSRLY